MWQVCGTDGTRAAAFYVAGVALVALRLWLCWRLGLAGAAGLRVAGVALGDIEADFVVLGSTLL